MSLRYSDLTAPSSRLRMGGGPRTEAEDKLDDLGHKSTLRRAIASSFDADAAGSARYDMDVAEAENDRQAYEAAQAAYQRANSRLRAAAPSGSQTYSEVEEAGDYGNFIANTAGSAIGSMAKPVIGGLLGAGVGSVAGPVGALVGGYGGGSVGGYDVNRSGNANQIAQDEQLSTLSAQERADMASNTAYGQAALDAALPGLVAAGGRPVQSAIRAFGRPGALIGAMGGEGLTEGSQDYLFQRAAQERFPDRQTDWQSIRDNAIAGAVGGGVLSGPSALLSGRDGAENARDDGTPLGVPPADGAPPRGPSIMDRARAFKERATTPSADQAPVDLGGVPPVPPSGVERIRPEDIAANNLPRDDGIPLGEAPTENSTLGRAKDKLDSTLGRLKSVASGALDSSAEALSQKLLLGDTDPGLAGATVEETQANLASNRVERVMAANTLRAELLARADVPDAVKAKLEALGPITEDNVNSAGIQIGGVAKAISTAESAAEKVKKLTDTVGKLAEKAKSSVTDRVKGVKHNLMGGTPAERAGLLDIAMAGLTPEAANTPAVQDNLQDVASAVAALALRTGSITKKDLALITDIQDSLTLFKDPQATVKAMYELLAPGLGEGQDGIVQSSFINAVLSVSTATNDLRNNGKNTFAYRMARPEMQAHQLFNPVVGPGIDRAVAEVLSGGPGRYYKALEEIYGNKGRVDMVLDYYSAQLESTMTGGEAGVSSAVDRDELSPDYTEESVQGEREGGEQGVQIRDSIGSEESGDYLFADGKQRPFLAADAKGISDARRAAVESGRVADNAAFDEVPMSEYAEQRGLNPDTVAKDIRIDIVNRRNESLRKLVAALRLKGESGTETMNEALKLVKQDSPLLGSNESSRIISKNTKALHGQLALFDHLMETGGTKAVLDQYTTLRLAATESRDLVATDTDMRNMYVNLNSKDNKTGNVTFLTTDGKKVSLNSASMIRTMAKKRSQSAGKMGGIEYKRAAFYDAVAAVLNREDIQGLADKEKDVASVVIDTVDGRDITAGRVRDSEKIQKNLKAVGPYKADLEAASKRAREALAEFTDVPLDQMSGKHDNIPLHTKLMEEVQKRIDQRQKVIAQANEWWAKYMDILTKRDAAQTREEYTELDNALKAMDQGPKPALKDRDLRERSKRLDVIDRKLVEDMRSALSELEAAAKEKEANPEGVQDRYEGAEPERLYDDTTGESLKVSDKPDSEKRKNAKETLADTGNRPARPFDKITELAKLNESEYRTVSVKDGEGAFDVVLIDTPRLVGRPMAWTNKAGRIFVDARLLRESGRFLHYVQNSEQKKATLAGMGITPQQFVQLFSTNKERLSFLIWHERSHVKANDHAGYPRTADGALDLMNPKAIEIETRASLEALTPQQGKLLKKFIAKNKKDGKAAKVRQQLKEERAEGGVAAAPPVLAPSKLDMLISELAQQREATNRPWDVEREAEARADKTKTKAVKYDPFTDRTARPEAPLPNQETRKQNPDLKEPTPKPVVEGRTRPRKVGFTLTPSTDLNSKSIHYHAKDQRKADQATVMIGRGSPSSSTARYLEDAMRAKIPVNPPIIYSDDVVFVSAEGARKSRYSAKPMARFLKRAVDAGATILTDDRLGRAREWNEGEREVAVMLRAMGYVESKDGVWTPPNDGGKPTPKVRNVKNTFVGEKAMPASLKEHIEKYERRLGRKFDQKRVVELLMDRKGVFRGPEGKWRAEISPEMAVKKLTLAVERLLQDRSRNGSTIDLSSLIDALGMGDSYKDLFEGIEIVIGNVGNDLGADHPVNGDYAGLASLRGEDKSIHINSFNAALGALDLMDDGNTVVDGFFSEKASEGTLNDLLLRENHHALLQQLGDYAVMQGWERPDYTRAIVSTVMHEAQHAIQYVEGFQNGGNSNLAVVLKYSDKAAVEEAVLELLDKNSTKFDALLDEALGKLKAEYGPDADVEMIANNMYLSLTGEMEAHDVQKRLDYTDQERQDNLPALIANAQDIIQAPVVGYSPAERSSKRVLDLIETHRAKASKAKAKPGPRPKPAALEKTKQELLAELKKLRGKDVQLVFDKLTSALKGSGQYRQELSGMNWQRVVEVAINAGNPMGALRHEALHDFFATILPNYASRTVLRDLKAVAMSPRIQNQLRELLKNEKAALEQLTDPEEAVAYMYQFWAEGQLKVHEKPAGFLNTIRNFLKDFFNIISRDERAEKLLELFNEGSFGKPSAVASAIADLGDAVVTDKLQRLSPMLHDRLSEIGRLAPDTLRSFQDSSLDELANMFDNQAEGKMGFLQRRLQKGAKWDNRLAEILKGASASEMGAVLDAFQNMEPQTTELGRAVEAYLKDIGAYMQRSGVQTVTYVKDPKTGERVPHWIPMRVVEKGYFPREWDRAAILNNPDKWTALLKKHSNMDDKAIANITQAIVTGTGQIELAENEHSLGFTPYSKAAQERGFKFIRPENAAEFNEFQTKNMAEILYAYTKQAVHRAEYAAQFGNNGEVIQQLVQDSGIKDAAELRKVFKTIEGLEGSLGNDMTASTKELMANVLTLQNLVLLPLAIFSQMIDPVVLAARSGDIKDAGRAYLAGLKTLKRFVMQNPDDKLLGEDLAQLIGTVSQDTVLEAMGQAWGSTQMSAGARHVNRLFFKYNGMQGWNNAMRSVATKAGTQYIIRHQSDVDAMHELGLKPSDVKLNEDGTLDVSPEKIQEALFKFVDQAVIRPNAALRPTWMSDPRWMLVGHLKQFVFAMHHVVMGRAAKQMERGNFAPMGILMLAMPAIVAADLAKTVLTGSTHMDSMSFIELFGHAISRSGLLGLGDFGSQVVSDAERLRFPGESLLGPAFEHAATILRGLSGSPIVDLGDVIDRTIPGVRYL